MAPGHLPFNLAIRIGQLARPLGYRFALGALDAAERLREVGSNAFPSQQMVYDQLRILGATQRTTNDDSSHQERDFLTPNRACVDHEAQCLSFCCACA